MRKFFVAVLAGAAYVLGSSAGHATNIAVSVTETSVTGLSMVVASWVQDQNPVPETYSKGYYTTVAVRDAVGLGGDTAISWYSSINSQLGGFTNYNEDYNILAPTSYSSDESSPTFIPGTYSGVDIKQDFTYLLASYSITVLPEANFRSALARFSPASSVPEPVTWAMMIGGMGMIGLAARRRRTLIVTHG